MGVEDALTRAREEGLDLVEVAAKSRPPVCRIMDYGKFKYQQKKRASEAKKHQVQILVKEVKFRPKTEEHDYQFKLAHARRFLEAGNRAKITMRFRGREIAHSHRALTMLHRLAMDLEDAGAIELQPRLEGRAMIMILSPRKDRPKPKDG